MSGFDIPALTRDRQDRASQPRASAWVSANAGSGKTFVLSRRVVRLLLDGTDPSRILALTFTKAAAAEMATRVFNILGTWVTMDGDQLAGELEAIEGRPPKPERIAFARRLFATALETPGGLKIQTIHGFCEALLHQFPLEANVAGHFSVLDDRKAGELMAEARAGALFLAETDPQGTLGSALGTVIDLMSDGAAQKSLDELIRNRDGLRRWLTDTGGLDIALDTLATDFGIDPRADLAGADQAFRAECLLDEVACKRAAQALREGGATDQARAVALETAIQIEDCAEFRAKWQQVFLTGKLEPRKSLATKKVAEAFPDIVAVLEEEQARVLAALARRRVLVTFIGTAALLRLASAVIDRYENAKTSQGLLDFEDLVVKTARLLGSSDAAQWVQYKLDQGLDHILVDEAQDTSPRQWDVVGALAGEFFAGSGARETVRTLFAVGDEKQSIYSFQGAVPAYFDAMRKVFSSRAQQAQHTFHSVDLQLSFRSTPDVLSAVDLVFQDEAAHRGLSQDRKAPVHEPIRRDPGLVEIWPLEQEAEFSEPEDWRAPIDRIGTDAPAVRVARRIAETIGGWLRSGTAGAGDIMVLVRKRGAFVDLLNRELRQRNIPAAGSDRLVLTEHIAVQDLAALGRFLLLSEDDLSLAAVLKSPLFDLDDDQLLKIARDPDGRKRAGTLWQSLVTRSADDSTWDQVRRRLEGWRARADFMPPFEFYARLLSSDGGRRQFRARLGGEVDDVLDEFLNLTLDYEQTGTPGLEGFLAWMAAAATEIKRELTSSKGQVRIMTVHGSKGLEARFVILVDGGGKPVNAAHDPAFLPKPRDKAALLPPALVWLPQKTDRIPWHDDAVATLREAQEEEYRRLLYVALTRAEDRLVVCGWEPRKGMAEECWYSLVHRALAPTAAEVTGADGATISWRWRQTGGSDPEALEPTRPRPVSEPDAAGASLPDWLHAPAIPSPRRRRLQPSRVFELMEEKDGIDPPSSAMRLKARLSDPSWALERGRLVHRLLELLPGIPSAERPAAMERYLDSALRGPLLGRKAELLREIASVIGDPEFAPLFTGRARAEVPVIGTITTAGGEEMTVSGQIDRLIEFSDHLVIVDYKTNAHVPATAQTAPTDYLAQLAVYRRVVEGIFPDKPVRTALLWTAAPRLMPVPQELLDETFDRLRPDGTAA